MKLPDIRTVQDGAVLPKTASSSIEGGRMSVRLTLSTLLAAASAVLAQTTNTGSLAGAVTDSSGLPVMGATVDVASSVNGLTRTVTTSNAGAYRIDLLAAGFYSLKITKVNFSPVMSEKVGVAVNQTTTFNAVLKPGGQTETITVEAQGAPVVDMTASDVRLLVARNFADDLPLNGRDFVNLAILAPGAKPVDSYDPTKKRIGVFAVNGSSGRNINVTVNGIDDKDNTVGGPVMQLPLEAIEEFAISTQRFSAANGRSEGAAVNVVTRSGTNSWHGSLYYFERRDSFNALNYFEKTENGGSGTKSPFMRQQFGGSIGGPVRKDRDFFFFALERQREQTSLPVDPQAFAELSLAAGLGAKPARVIPTPYYDWRYHARWDHRINSRHNLFGSYTVQRNNGENDQSTATNDLTAGNFTKNRLILSGLTLNSVLTPRAVNSFTAGYQYWNNLIDSSVRVPAILFPNSIYFGTNPNIPQQSYQAKWQFRDDLSVTRGAHTWKVGFDYVGEPKLGGFFQFFTTPNISFLDLPSEILGDKAKYPQGFSTAGAVREITVTTGDPYFRANAKMLGAYVQDDWKVSRHVALNLGLRWEKDVNLLTGSKQAQNRTYLELKAIGSPYAGIPGDDSRDFSPRIGIVYDPSGTGRHVVRGGFGVYYGQVFSNISVFMLQQANPTLFAVAFDATSAGPGDLNADALPGLNILLSQWRYGVDPLPRIPPPATSFSGGEVGQIIHPGYRNPYTEQVNAGYTFEITTSNAIQADYVHTLGLREAKTYDINPKQPERDGARVLDAAFTGAGLPQLGRIFMQTSFGRSRYDGLNLSYRGRPARHLAVNASYVLSRALSYNGPAASFYNPPFDNFHFLAATDLGPTASDSTHRGVIAAVAELRWGVRIATTLQAESARPYNATQGIDVLGQGGPPESFHAILLKNRPGDYTATADMSAEQLRTCLGAGNCVVSGFNSLRGKPYFQLDFRAGKRFAVKERASVEVFFQGFNLTNRANFGGTYNNDVRSATFGTPNGFITPSGLIIPRSFCGEFGAQMRF